MEIVQEQGQMEYIFRSMVIVSHHKITGTMVHLLSHLFLLVSIVYHYILP